MYCDYALGSGLDYIFHVRFGRIETVKKKQSTTELIRELATELGYAVAVVDTNASSPVLSISDGKRYCLVDEFTFGYYPTNLRWQNALYKDKITTQKVLEKNGITTIPSTFYRIHEYESGAALERALTKRHPKFPLLLKPAAGHDGRNISIVRSRSGLIRSVRALYRDKLDFLVQPLLDHEEYRIFIAHGKIMVVHSKDHKYIRSDGVRPIEEQLTRVRDDKKSDDFLRAFLKEKGWTMKTIPPAREKICYHFAKDNTRGYLRTERFSPELTKWAECLSAAIDPRIVGVDIFAPKGVDAPASFIVIELNGNPTLRDYAQTYRSKELAKKIYARELKVYFARS